MLASISLILLNFAVMSLSFALYVSNRRIDWLKEEVDKLKGKK